MTGTPPPPPRESTGDAPDHGDDERRAARSGQHESPTPPPAEPSAGHGRHEMAGSAGYPQFEGPGAAQYGSEPVESAPPMTPRQQSSYEPGGAQPPQSAAPSHDPSGPSAQPGYVPPGTPSQQSAQPSYAPTGMPPQQSAQSGYVPSGTPPQQSAQPGYPPSGTPPQPSYAPQEQGYGPSGPPPQQTPQPSYGPPGTPPQQPVEPSYGPPGTGAPYGPPPDQYAAQPGMAPPPGAPPPDQPVYGYQQAATAPGTLDVGQALSYGWERFRSNFGPWLAVVACGLVIYLAFVVIVQLTNPTSMLPLLLVFLAVLAGVWLLQAAMVRGALYETDGTKPSFGSYFRFVNAGNVLLTALLAFALTCIASAACLLPGLVVGILCMFSLHFVVDQNEGPFEAIKSSAMLVIANIWPVLLLTLSVLLVTFVGALLCGLGLLIAGPVSVIAVTYAYRTLTGGVVAAL
ncbi:hypothetical protein [Nocardia brasiliensis]|uniref:hypothetical protein n=1 Tax=Nocardia brasiliensis TaxID=37326 RepID=UPI002454F9BF|nr:hypothetical protein [Nocardia brasiliensis]